MMKILQVTLGLDATHALWVLTAMLAFTAFYTTLANYKGTVTSGTQAGQTYFNPCSTDPGQSTFVCNLKPTGYCGSLGMPLGITVANPGPIATWVACGAPEN